MALVTTALATLLLIQDAQEAQPAPTPPPPCSGEEFRAFDFWVGEWDVSPNGSDQQVATSKIESVSNGCAIRETWMPLNGGGGTSTTALDPRSGVWHQQWIGAQPGEVHFHGGLVDGAMILTGYWGRNQAGQPNLVRMTYTVQEDGAVRQHGQASTDHGLTWSDSFDLIYRPREE
ncbi:hypothetical protein [Aurantiacibacter sp. D1-12]|uniref:hypothetical protein n=1 Tax=Aurantiacibacter sp. D1-12 TaxID=2993658 RepID=UPI00237CBD99|nr:hypothetical protein [Aurantiacibacter sp. D1-12]MDE1466555.1 hypothetical protein [Aurantiacibacter sp. D1-12]